MKPLAILGCLIMLATGGCVSKSKANAQARAAFLAGRRQGLAMAAQGPAVWVEGNVKKPIVPWTEDMTLAKAMIAAEYLGRRDPGEIIVEREGETPLHFRAAQLLQGQDMPLKAGDHILIRP